MSEGRTSQNGDLHAPEDNEPPGRFSRVLPGVRWQSALREFVLIVAGVLVALAAQAWWQSRDDRALERVYLHQLRADLTETERIIAQADTSMAPVSQALNALQYSFGEPHRPPRDSVFALMRTGVGGWDRIRPVLGTAEAMIATGDLSLIRDDDLRNAIVGYVEEQRSEMAAYRYAWEGAREAWIAFAASVDPREMALYRMSEGKRDSVLQNVWRPPFPLDLEAFYGDRDAYGVITHLWNWAGVHAQNRRRLRENAASLREEIEGQLGP